MTTYKLLSTTGDQSVDVTPSQTLIVGRAVTSDIPIYDPTVSRQHAELALADGGVHVKDLGSSNGTFVNGEQIAEHVAHPEDIVTFGKVAFKVIEVSPPKAEPIDQGGFAPRPPEATIVRQVAEPRSP